MRPKRAQGGVTLIELVIAMAVIAIALMQIVGVIAHTIRMKESTREKERAKEGAASKIDEIRAHNFDNIVADFQNGTFNVEGLSFSQNNPTLQGLGLIQIDASNTSLLDVKVTITWDTTGGRTEYKARALLTR